MIKNHVFGEVKINYDGPLDLNNFYALIQNYFFNKSYEFTEVLDEEINHEAGKSILVDMLFYKKYTNYYKGEIFVKLRMNNIFPIVLEGKNLFQGDVNIKVEGHIVSDYENNWSEIKKDRYDYKKKEYEKITVGTFRWFLKLFANKYLYKKDFNLYTKWVMRDANELLEQTRSFLNIYNLREKSKL